MINPKLKEGDRVVVLHMDDDISPIPMGTTGTVLQHSVVFGDDQYVIKWDNGSRLSLIDGIDMWDFEENYKSKRKKKITEMNIDSFKKVTSGNNADVFRYFNAKFLRKYLLTLRDSGITNMFGAAPYLYIGRERLEHEFKYKNVPNEEKFDELLDMADQAQAEMINGVIDYLESKGIEENMDNINRYLKKFATMIVQNYIHIG
jgi:hypothetical protein